MYGSPGRYYPDEYAVLPYSEGITQRRRCMKTTIEQKVRQIYGDESGGRIYQDLQERMSRVSIRPKKSDIDERTAIAITYGDHIQSKGTSALQSLQGFFAEEFHDLMSHVHILPFYPYSSDDGFSVIDYTAVDPKLGDWDDIRHFSEKFGLMFDFVLNHISAKSEWFQAFLRDDPDYKDFFIVMDPATDLSMVRRPRTSPLLTPFETPSGTKHVWTTFSDDQIDLNYANPKVFLAMVDVLFTYVQQGADFIRMDAITYLWKEAGTESVHHENTHLIAQLFRDILDEVAPHVRIITETNVPHHENISYFGDGHNEAHGVYNFALPPLLLHTLQTGDKAAFDTWASTLELPSDDTFFFNFTASHDGIGVTPVKGILSPDEIAGMIERVDQHGGLVSYKTTASGNLEPYELNTTYYNALSSPDDDAMLADARFMVSQAIMLAMKGVPGVYFGSLVGNKNWQEGPEKLGYNRAINRQKLLHGRDIDSDGLNDPTNERGRIAVAYKKLLAARTSEPAFSPRAAMEILTIHPSVVAIRRTAGEHDVIALHNITNETISYELAGEWHDLLADEFSADGGMLLSPYGVKWLKRSADKQ